MRKILMVGCLVAVGSMAMAKEVAPVVAAPIIVPMVEEITPECHNYVKVGIDFGGTYKMGDEITTSLGNLIGGNSRYERIEGRGLTPMGSSDLDATNRGFEVALERTKQVSNGWELGLGMAAQIHRDGDARIPMGWDGDYDFDMFMLGSYNSIPLYALAKYNFNLPWTCKPYFKVALGYSFNFDSDFEVSDAWDSMKLDSEVDNGLYWAAGVGVERNNWIVEAMYQVNMAELEVEMNMLPIAQSAATRSPYMNKMKADADYERITVSIGYKF